MRHAESRLQDLLSECFSSDELRWFLQDGPSGGALARGLPTGSPSMDLLVRAAVELLERHGLLDASLFRRLLSTRPARRVRIVGVAAGYGILLVDPPAKDIELLALFERKQDTEIVDALLTATARLNYSHVLREQVHVFGAALRACRTSLDPDALPQLASQLSAIAVEIAGLDGDARESEDGGGDAGTLHDEITASIRDNDIARAATRLLDMARVVGAPRVRMDDLAALRQRVEQLHGEPNRTSWDAAGGWLETIREVLGQADGLRGLAAVSSPNVSLGDARRHFAAARGSSGDSPGMTLSCSDITLTYPPVVGASPFILSGVSLRLAPGTITGVFGANGSGKTTLLRILAGQIAPTAGHLEFPGIDADAKRRGRIDWAKVRRWIAYVEQRPPRSYDLLANELHRWAGLHGLLGEQNEAEVEFYLHRLDLYRFRGTKWSMLSEGYRMRFELARALLARPKLLVLDEPLAPLDITMQQPFLRDLRDLAAAAQDPVAVILSSQHIPEVEAIADQVLCLTEDGHVRFIGSCKELAAVSEWHVLELAGHLPPRVLDSLRPTFGLRDVRRWSDSWIVRIPRRVPIPEFGRAAFDAYPALNHIRDITGSCTKFFRGE